MAAKGLCNDETEMGFLDLVATGKRAAGARQWALAAGGADERYYREMQAIISGFSSHDAKMSDLILSGSKGLQWEYGNLFY